MTEIPFIKMHGISNDFVVLDARTDAIDLSEDTIRAIGDRKRGVGFDQLLTLKPAENGADVFMGIHNPDGSTAGACGNGTRCVARLIMDQTGTDQVSIDTVGGLLLARDAGNGLVTVDMGVPRTDWQQIPLSAEMDTASVPYSITDANGVTYANPVAVSMGNPHLVFTVDNAETVPLTEIGPLIEHADILPDRANVSFVSRREDGTLRLRVWERGAGITGACGSGTCATAYAATQRGMMDGRTRIDLDGGPLWMEIDDRGHILMTGGASYSFHARFDPEKLDRV